MLLAPQVYCWQHSVCDIKQLVTDPTHIHGNSLDLLCSSRPDHGMNTAVKCPSVSDHFIIIITASVILDDDVSTSIIRSNYTVKLYRQRDVDIDDGFQQDMDRMKDKLSEINNVDDMWTLFSSTLLRAVDKHDVPKKTKYNNPLHSEPMWFNSDSRKMTKKLRILYNKQKKTCDPL